MFLKFETTTNEYVAINSDKIVAIRDFGNDTTLIISESVSPTYFYVKKSYIDVLGELNAS
jgi:hypothetical protein